MVTSSDHSCGRRGNLNSVVTLFILRLPRRPRRRSEDIGNMLNKQFFFLYFPKLPSFSKSNDNFLSYLTRKKCAIFGHFLKMTLFYS